VAGAVRLALPPDLAAELIDAGIVAPSVMTRSVGEVAQLLIDGVNTGSAAVTVAVAATAVPRVWQRVAARARGARTDGQATVTLRHGSSERVIVLPPELSLDDVSALLQQSLAEVSAPPGN